MDSSSLSVSGNVMEMYSGKDKIVVSAAASYSQEHPRTPRRLKITMRFSPDAPCGLVKNPDGTCVVRPIIDPGKQLEILRAVLKNNLHNPPCDPQSCSVPDRDKNKIRVFNTGSLKVKKQEPKPTCDPGLEIRLKESKRKLQEQYKSIEERRKRIKLIDARDVPVPPPEMPNTRRRRW